MEKERIDEFDMWFSDNAGNKIRELTELVATYGNCRNLYESKSLDRWPRNIDKYRRVMDSLERLGIRMSKYTDAHYPEKLKNIFDPPYVIYYKGELPEEERRCCAVIGSRKATPYGRNTAYGIGKVLGTYNVGVISGMALGADSFAHRGALDAGGYTLAVLGSGVDQCTPASNHSLMDSILEKGGCVMSEFLPGTPGYAANYPRRNRIISGMSEGVIVTEADERSGTSITARLALEQGRDVYAVPGNINSFLSRGTNRLIKDGATPLISKEDILEELGIKEEKTGQEKKMLGPAELDIYKYIEQYGSVTMDQLCRELKKTSIELGGIITVLEIKGFILRSFGKINIAK